ncbi:hypothetical protein BCI9360_00460 [Bacillus sp. CECT 9360]|nr:hypothetical protein BCI9360_00460 [Bacillus sp. CECT 9360]
MISHVGKARHSNNYGRMLGFHHLFLYHQVVFVTIAFDVFYLVHEH